MRQKNLARRGPAATIAKPIRAGQPHPIANQPTIRTGITTPVKPIEEQKRRSLMVGDKGKKFLSIIKIILERVYKCLFDVSLVYTPVYGVMSVISVVTR